MAAPRFLVENFFDTDMFTGHTLTAEEEADNKEVERIASARREPRDHWAPTTSNDETYINVALDQPRYADMFVLDRGFQNLNGINIELRASWVAGVPAGNFDAVFSATVPANTYYGSRLEAGSLIRTSEGAVVCQFTGVMAPYWRLVISATTSGTVPTVVGAWLGKSLSLTRTPPGAWDDETGDLQFFESQSPGLRATASLKAQARTAQITIPLQGGAEFDEARYHIRDLYAKGFAMWYVPDTDYGERAWLSMAPPGSYAIPYTGNRNARTLPLTLVEHDPKRLL